MLTINEKPLLIHTTSHSTSAQAVSTLPPSIEPTSALEPSTFSSMARHLSVAAVQAADRERSLTPEQLRQHAAAVHQELFKDAAIPQQTPRNDELATLDAAAPLQTRSLNNSLFKTAPREHLSLIAYDGSRSFSLDERRVAWQELHNRDAFLRNTFINEAQQEIRQSSTLAKTAEKALRQFNNLSAIEKAQYPQEYAERLQDHANGRRLSGIHGQAATTRYIKTIFEPVGNHGPYQAISNPLATITQGRNEEGHKLLLSRRFGAFEPPVSKYSETHNAVHIAMPCANFLTRSDRTLLSHIYAYAQEQGADLNYVDDLARDLAHYRWSDDGRIMGTMNNGQCYDRQGRQLSVKFTPESAVIADRILGNKALDNTLLDKGFIRYAMDPGRTPYGVTCNVRFMEQIINRFSSTPDSTQPLDRRFVDYPKDGVNNKIISASQTVRRRPSPPPVAYVHNGVWTITAKGKAAGYVMDRLSGTPMLVKPATGASKKTGHWLDGFFDTPRRKNGFVTPFALMLMKYKAQGRVRRV